MSIRACFVALAIATAVGLNAQAGEGSAKKNEDSGEATRVGTCNDAKSQMEYFCDSKNAKNDTMVGFGTACNNAKKNVKEACEGIVEPDKEYKFKKN